MTVSFLLGLGCVSRVSLFFLLVLPLVFIGAGARERK
jgi:hypothetical protein